MARALRWFIIRLFDVSVMNVRVINVCQLVTNRVCVVACNPRGSGMLNLRVWEFYTDTVIFIG